MSDTETTTKYKPRPYFNVVNANEAEEGMKSFEQNPSEGFDRSKASSDTQTNHHDATSENSVRSEEATYEKRWKDLKKHYDEEVTRLRGEIRQLEQTKQENTFVPPKTPEELNAFKEANPDIYDAMLSVAYEQVSAHGNTASSRIRQLEETLAATEQEKAFAQIEKAHPDYTTVVNDPKFLEWVELQDSSIQSWVKTNSNNARQFIRALDLYKLDTGVTTHLPNRSEQVGARGTNYVDTSAAENVSVSGNSVNVGEGGKRIWSRDEINRMTPQEFAKHEAELDAAMFEGRVR